MDSAGLWVWGQPAVAVGRKTVHIPITPFSPPFLKRRKEQRFSRKRRRIDLSIFGRLFHFSSFLSSWDADCIVRRRALPFRWRRRRCFFFGFPIFLALAWEEEGWEERGKTFPDLRGGVGNGLASKIHAIHTMLKKSAGV